MSPPPSEAIAAVAKDLADETAKLTTHEAVCAERYGNIALLMTNLSVRIGKLEGLVWLVAGALLVGMAGMIVSRILFVGGH